MIKLKNINKFKLDDQERLTVIDLIYEKKNNNNNTNNRTVISLNRDRGYKYLWTGANIQIVHYFRHGYLEEEKSMIDSLPLEQNI